MIEFKYNDGGRAKAGYKGNTGDCGVRAIAIATGIPYQEVYDMVIEYGSKERNTKKVKRRGKSHPRTGIWKPTMIKIMNDLGWEWKPLMGIGTGCQVHLRKSELPKGRIICSLSKHYAAVVDGVLHDTYDDSRNGKRCVYGYFRKVNK